MHCPISKILGARAPRPRIDALTGGQIPRFLIDFADHRHNSTDIYCLAQSYKRPWSAWCKYTCYRIPDSFISVVLW